MKAEILRVLKPGGFDFWEDPNVKCPSNGTKKGKVNILRTYFFEMTFFEEWFSRTILCDGCEKSQMFNVLQDWKRFEGDED